MLGFGKAKERRRQWAMLGLLLRRLPLLEALDILDRGHGRKAVNWPWIRQKAALGMTLSEIVKDGEPKTPTEVVDALREGEKDGRLPERLEELREPEEATPFSDVEEAGIVGLVNDILAAAIKIGTPRFRLRLAEGNLWADYPGGESWLPVLDVGMPGAFFPAVQRRLWILSGQPYWAPKAGSFRTRLPEGDVEVRLAPPTNGELIVELSRTPPKG